MSMALSRPRCFSFRIRSPGITPSKKTFSFSPTSRLYGEAKTIFFRRKACRASVTAVEVEIPGTPATLRIFSPTSRSYPGPRMKLPVVQA